MLSEKLTKKMGTIAKEFEKRGYALEEDLIELCETRKDIAERIENTNSIHVYTYRRRIFEILTYICVRGTPP